MASPRLICKSAYIKDAAHFFELLEYSGDKIAAQRIVFKDGSEVQVNADDIITLSAAEQEAVQGIRITFKDGGRDRIISYDTYHRKTLERKEVIRYSDIAVVRDDSITFGVGTGPHEMRDLDFFRYLSYIDGRPGVEKEDGHGLFGLDGNVDIEEAKAMAAEHGQSCKWSHIISMDAQDAADTGFDNRTAWKNLIISKAPEIAKTYGISLANLVINCAYHANTDNPHVHLMFYSKDSTEGFVKGGTDGMNKASEHLKSTLVNTIFKNETAELGKAKSTQRNAMKQQMQAQMTSLMQSSVSSFTQPLEKLSDKLEKIDGKKVYDYLPSAVKSEVDGLVEALITENKDLTAMFNSYCDVQGRMIGRYVVSPEVLQDKLGEFKTAFFHPKKQDLKLYHNMVIRAAMELSEGRRQWQQAPRLLRTTEEKIEDDNIDLPNLSSPHTEEASLGYLPKEEWQKMNDFLKKSIREHLNCCLTDTNSFSAAFVRQKLERMRDSPSAQDSGELFTFLYQTSEQLRGEVDNYLGNIYGQLKEKVSAAVAGAFVSSYRAELFRGGEHNPIHNSIAWYAKCLDENLFNVILRENKEPLKSINTTIIKGLWNNIEDCEMLPLMQTLRAIPADDAAARQAAIKSIRQLIYQKEHGSSGETVFDSDLEHSVQSYKQIFKKYADPNTALSFEERLRTYLWQADPSCSFSYIISHFSDELDSHRCENFLKHQLKSEEIKTYRTHLYQSLQHVYRSGGEDEERLQAIFDRLPVDDTGAAAFNKKAMDEVLGLLSSPKHDMIAMKDELMGSMFSNLAESGINLSLDAKEQKKVFDSFFYGDGLNTFFFREALQKVAVDGIPPPTNIFLLRRLLLDIGRAICSQNNNAQRYSSHTDAEHSFRGKKQFRNVKFPREQEEAHY